MRSLDRFIEAQQAVWDTVVAELAAGQKRTHWSWFVFPQIRGLGESAMAVKFSIQSMEEAHAYWRHPLLGHRLRRCIELMMQHDGRFTAEEVLGSLDALKFQSCLTLFEQAVPSEPVFRTALETLFQGSRSVRTLEILG